LRKTLLAWAGAVAIPIALGACCGEPAQEGAVRVFRDRTVHILARSYYEPPGARDPSERKVIDEEVGTGFIVADGWIVTAKHVVQPHR